MIINTFFKFQMSRSQKFWLQIQKSELWNAQSQIWGLMPKLRLSEWGMPTTEYLREIKLIGRYKYISCRDQRLIFRFEYKISDSRVWKFYVGHCLSSWSWYLILILRFTAQQFQLLGTFLLTKLEFYFHPEILNTTIQISGHI